MNGEQNPTIQIKEADRLEITTIIDNYSDHTLPMSESPSEMVKRIPPAVEGRIPSDTLLAEHGLCLLVKAFKNGTDHSVLLDAGWSKIGVPHNMEMLAVDTSGIEAVVISHGHMDHFGALPEVLEIVTHRGISVIIHPDAFLPRALSLPIGAKIGMPILEESSIQKTGVNVVKTKTPHALASGLIFSLGEVERVTDFEKGMPGAIIEREGNFESDLILDDHGLVMNIRGKGLVVITGCAHSGIINTVKYAKKITGVDTVYAVMGGFHLTGPEFIPLTERTIQELEKINPSVIVPMHCTCWVAINWIASRFSKQFHLNSVGTTFCF
ncbi:MAG: MBL fold metallo-hydrolase [Thermodesulfobacteriota bacterium]